MKKNLWFGVLCVLSYQAALGFKYYSIDCVFPFFLVCKQLDDGQWMGHAYVICQDSEAVPKVHFGLASQPSLDTKTNYTAISIREEIRKKKTVLSSRDYHRFVHQRKLSKETWYTENYLVRIPAMILKEFVESFKTQLVFKDEYGPLKIVNFKRILQEEPVPILGAYSYTPLKNQLDQMISEVLADHFAVDVTFDRDKVTMFLVELFTLYLRKYSDQLENADSLLTEDDLKTVLVDLSGHKAHPKTADLIPFMRSLPMAFHHKCALYSLRRSCTPEHSFVLEEAFCELKTMFQTYIKQFTLRVSMSQHYMGHYEIKMLRALADLDESRFGFNRENKVLETYTGPPHSAPTVPGHCFEQVHELRFSF